MSISLKVGANIVVYTGNAQLASAAFASIASYIEIIYHCNNTTGEFELITSNTLMMPYGVYYLEITQACIWSYGIDTTPPNSVQLYTRFTGNYVSYCGPEQLAGNAFGLIIPYIEKVYYWNNITSQYKLVTSSTLMIPYGVYYLEVTQDCLWIFAELGQSISQFVIADFSKV